jgi:hypothetical protein
MLRMGLLALLGQEAAAHGAHDFNDAQYGPLDPSRIITDRLIADFIAHRGAKIIHQVNHNVSATTLTRELIVLLVELMTIKTESEFHKNAMIIFLLSRP